jgi:hypothetical protein
MGEQTTVRTIGQGETSITRTSHGDIKYISLASRLTERKYAVALRGLQGAKGLEREGEVSREGEAPAEPRGRPASGVRQHPADAALEEVVNHREAHTSRSPMDVPPVGDCSRFGDARRMTSDPGVMSNAATADESAVYDEIERRRRAFLSALENDTSPVQPPRVDAGGMLVEEAEGERETGAREQETEEMALASVLPMAALTDTSTDACPTARPLSRRERRARQRMLEKKLRMRKAK